MNKEKQKNQIVEFLKRDVANFGEKIVNGKVYKPHYNSTQISLFSDLSTPSNSILNELVKEGRIGFYTFEEHGKCYYAI